MPARAGTVVGKCVYGTAQWMRVDMAVPCPGTGIPPPSPLTTLATGTTSAHHSQTITEARTVLGVGEGKPP